MEYAWLCIGAQVVCVGMNDCDRNPAIALHNPGRPSPLERGAVYTVRDVVIMCGRPYIRVEEIRLPGGFLEPVADALGFRPVEKPKRSTSIEVFRKIDAGVFGKVDA